jgi:hypothetical protein
VGDVCNKCGRETYESVCDRLGPKATLMERLSPASCGESGDDDCHDAAIEATYQRGLRAGVELAKDKAFIWERIALSEIDWTDVDAALAEKLGGGG